MTVLVGPNGKLTPVARMGRQGNSQAVRTGPGSVSLLGRDWRVATYEAIYRIQPWVFVCVNKLARGIARLPLKVFEFNDPERNDRQQIKDHPLAELLQNPWPGGSPYRLKEALIGSRAIYGNALVVKARPGPGRAPTELWPVPWRIVEVTSDASGVPNAYVLHFEQVDVWLEPSDVIHLREYGAGGPVGVSPLEPLRRTLQLEDAAQQWAAHHFVNNATPSGVFKTEKTLNEITIPRLRAELHNLYGGIENAGRFGLFDQGLSWQPLSHTAVDTALIEQRKLSREEVAAVYDIPPPLIGILDRATFANITELHQALYVDTLGPWLTEYDEAFQAQLIQGEPDFEGVFVEFILDEILKGDVEKRSGAYQRFLQSATYSPNEMRRLENLPRINDPRADAIYIPLNMIPVGASIEEVEARARAIAAIGPPAGEQRESDPKTNGHAERDEDWLRVTRP